jgi:hypothetical protein
MRGCTSAATGTVPKAGGPALFHLAAGVDQLFSGFRKGRAGIFARQWILLGFLGYRCMPGFELQCREGLSQVFQ